MTPLSPATCLHVSRWIHDPPVGTFVHFAKIFRFSPPRTPPPALDLLATLVPARARTGPELHRPLHDPHRERTARIQIP
jgi:hypothetical protein